MLSAVHIAVHTDTITVSELINTVNIVQGHGAELLVDVGVLLGCALIGVESPQGQSLEHQRYGLSECATGKRYIQCLGELLIVVGSTAEAY